MLLMICLELPTCPHPFSRQGVHIPVGGGGTTDGQDYPFWGLEKLAACTLSGVLAGRGALDLSGNALKGFPFCKGQIHLMWIHRLIAHTRIEFGTIMHLS